MKTITFLSNWGAALILTLALVFTPPVKADGGYCPPHISAAIEKIADQAKTDPANESDYTAQIESLLDIGDCRDLIPWRRIKAAISSSVALEVDRLREQNKREIDGRFSLMLPVDVTEQVAENAGWLGRRIDENVSDIASVGRLLDKQIVRIDKLTASVVKLVEAIGHLNQTIEDAAKASVTPSAAVSGSSRSNPSPATPEPPKPPAVTYSFDGHLEYSFENRWHTVRWPDLPSGFWWGAWFSETGNEIDRAGTSDGVAKYPVLSACDKPMVFKLKKDYDGEWERSIPIPAKSC